MERDVPGSVRQERQAPGQPGPGEHQTDPVPAQLSRDVDPEARQAEELRLLVVGFLTGLSIAAVFLVYIVLESAKLLP